MRFSQLINSFARGNGYLVGSQALCRSQIAAELLWRGERRCDGFWIIAIPTAKRAAFTEHDLKFGNVLESISASNYFHIKSSSSLRKRLNLRFRRLRWCNIS